MDREQYRVLELLGQGATSRVYRGIQVELDREVVIKILKTAEPAVRERFLREAKLLAALHHPSIGGIIDFGMNDDDAFMVLPFVPGKTLATLLEEKQILDWRATLQIASPIAAGLHAAHDAGIVHRDLKPSNVYLPDSGKPILIDFGLGRGPSDPGLTAAGLFMGTPLYAAPEMVFGDPAVPASDVYSLGVMITECLTGKNPFDRETLKEVLAAHAYHVVEKMDGLPVGSPDGLEKLLLSMMAKKAADRPASAAEVHQRLQFMLGESVSGQLVPPRRTGRKPAQDHQAPRTAPGRLRRGALLAGSLVTVIFLTMALLRWIVHVRRAGPGIQASRRPVVELGATGEIAVRWEKLDPAKGPVEIVGPGGTWARQVIAGEQGSLEHEGAPPVTEFQIRQGNEILGEGRTPEYYPLVHFRIHSMDDRVLVGALFSRHCPVAMQVRSLDGRVVVRVDVPEVKRKHRHVLEGLSPGHEYRLDILVPGAWGGFRSFAFRTLDSSHRTELRRATRYDWGTTGRLDLHGSALLAGQPDVRLVPILKQILDKERDPTTLSVVLMRHLESIFDPRLDDEILAAMEARPGDHSLGYQLNEVLASSGSSAALPQAMQRLKRDPGNPRGILSIADAALHTGRAQDFESCVKVFESSGRIDEVAILGMEAMDPARAMATYRKWLDAILENRLAPGRVLPQACALALRVVPREELERMETRCTTPLLRQYWIEALVEADTPATRAHLLDSFRRAPGDLPLLWAMARTGTKEAVTSITEGLRTATGLLLADSIAALGLIGAPGSIPRIEEHLTHPDPYARRAAAWALGRMNSNASADKLLEMAVAGRDDHGLAAWALGQIGAREASARLSSHLVDLLVSSAPVSWDRLGLMILALQRLGHPVPALPGKLPPGAAPLPSWLQLFADGDAAPFDNVLLHRDVDHFPWILEERVLEDVPDAITGVMVQRGGWSFEDTDPVRPCDRAEADGITRLTTLRVDHLAIQLYRPTFALALPRTRTLMIRSWPQWTPRFYDPHRLEARGMLRLGATFLR